MQYIHKYLTTSAFNEDWGGSYKEPWVSLNKENGEIKFNKTEYEKLLGTPLTFEITGDGNIVWKASSTAYTITLEYKKNDGEWTEIASTTAGAIIPVVSGDIIQFRAPEGTTYDTMSSGSSRYNTFSGSTAQFSVKGNIMSLLNSTSFTTMTSLSSAYTFYDLFKSCTGLTDASKLILPATTLAVDCYRSMFFNCTSLATAPALPATTLVGNCYQSMFNGCTSLATAPELPATTLASQCYYQMFYGCTSLTTAPELPATTLANSCYYFMFNGCTNLNFIKCLATNISASNCTYSWVSGVASTGIFIKNPNMTSWTTGVNGIPEGWTVIDAE